MNISITVMLDLREVIRQHYLKFLNREPDLEGLEHYFLEIRNNRIKMINIKSESRLKKDKKT